MIIKGYILQSLTQIDKLYRASSNPKHTLFYSKLAILELCGWIEETMDEIILTCAKRHIKDPAYFSFVDTKIIRTTYGFEYNKYFRNMLLQLLGVINLERLESRLDHNKFDLMRSNLDSLKTFRDAEAHTHIKGFTKRLDAPSTTKARFFPVYEGLKDIENNLSRLKL